MSQENSNSSDQTKPKGKLSGTFLNSLNILNQSIKDMTQELKRISEIQTDHEKRLVSVEEFNEEIVELTKELSSIEIEDTPNDVPDNDANNDELPNYNTVDPTPAVENVKGTNADNIPEHIKHRIKGYGRTK